MTLDRLQVALGRVWGPGMAYTALSRASCLEGLQVLDELPASKVIAHQAVLDFYRALAAQKGGKGRSRVLQPVNRLQESKSSEQPGSKRAMHAGPLRH